MYMRKWTAACLLAVAAITISACGVGPDKSREDAGDAHASQVDKTPPRVSAFNNHYPNVENKCDGHGHRIFVATHNSSTGRNFIVLPDPSCPGYQKGTGTVIITQQ